MSARDLHGLNGNPVLAKYRLQQMPDQDLFGEPLNKYG